MNLSNKINYDGFIYMDDVKEFIQLLKFWADIDLGEQTLTIDYDKFKELVGDKLI